MFSKISIAVLALILTVGLWWDLADLPNQTLCMFKRIFTQDCPGCGLTRAFLLIPKGEWRAAWQLNPGSFALYGFFAAVFGNELQKLLRGKPSHRSVFDRVVVPIWAVVILIIFCVSMVYRWGLFG